MTLSNSFFLRGAFQHQEHLSVARHSKDIFTRWLQEEGDIVQKDHETDQSGGNVTYVVIVGIFLALVGCCCLHSMWHRVHRRFGPSTDGGPILDHNGLKNKLDPTQRRATLEAIFSETSKAVTDSMFFKRTDETDSDKNDEKGIPSDVTSSTTDDDAETIDLEASGSETWSPVSTTEYNDPGTPNSFDAADGEWPKGHQDIPPDMPSSSVAEGDSASSGVSSSVARPSLTRKISKGHSIDVLAGLSLPTLEEEPSGEETLPPLKLAPSSKCTQSVNFSNEKSDAESVQSDEEEYVCAICLSDYETGDLIISSRYCSHIYHKDCILEWLEKSNDCPCCRVAMMTNGEMTEAAISVLGKPKLVESMRAFRNASSSHPLSFGVDQGRRSSRSPRAHQMGRVGLASPPILLWTDSRQGISP